MSEQPSKSGMIVSGALHAALLGAILVGFSQAPKFDDAGESMPVETITQSQFNQIMKGERTGKPAPAPVEKPAPKPIEATAPSPPAEPAKIEPPVLRHIDDPGQDETPAPPPKPVAATPPPPAPPQREAAAPPPPPPPDDAEIDRIKPKIDPKAVPTPPAPPTRPKVVEKPPERPKDPTPDKPKSDSVAKFLEKVKAEEDQKPSKPKSGDAPVDPPRQAYDPNAIAKLIGQAKPAPNKQVASLTALGSPTQNAPRMSPSLSASLDGWLQEAYLNCWTQPPTMPEGVKYVAQVHVTFNADGSLGAEPQLVNPPGDPAWRAYAESAMRAVQRCNPLHVPPQYVPYYEQWRTKTVHFDPQDAQG